MQHRSRRQFLSRPTRQYLSVVAGEAKQLFRRRKIAYGVIAAAITGASLLAASLAATSERPSPSRPLTAQGDTMDDKASQQAQGSTNGTHIESNIQSQTYSSGSGTQQHSSVTVNGQQLTVPDNGSLHATVPAGDGSASVNISRTSSGGNGQSDSLSVDVEAQGGNMPSE